MSERQPRAVHVVGVGGIGVSAVAKMLAHEGVRVTGSDVAASETTAELEDAGIPVAIGHDAANLPDDAETVVYSGAVPDDNPELVLARERGIPCHTYFEFLGGFSRGRRTVTVSGTNGKSTTTAMLGMMLVEAGMDPTVIVGSKVPGFPDRNLRLGGSDLFVVEACEHEANMLNFRPDLAVITNVEEDHLDFYRDREHIVATFQRFIDGIREGGTLVLNADDRGAFYELSPKSRFVTFAIDADADYKVGDMGTGEGEQTFTMTRRAPRTESLGTFTLRVPGRFNVANAAAAIAAALELGASPEACAAALSRYGGIWRRFEYVGERDGAVVISDYGHHPTALRGTVEAARQFYPGWRIVLCFQPHQHNRTKNLFGEFVAAMDGADVVILPRIFDVAGREESHDQDVTSEALAEAVRERDRERGAAREVRAVGGIDDARRELERVVRAGDVVLVMGAGDIYRIASPFAKGKEEGRPPGPDRTP